MRGARLVVFMWLVAVVIITWHYVKTGADRPPASAYAGAGVIYSLLAAMAAIPGAEPVAGTFAVGWTLALGYRVMAEGKGAGGGGAGRRPRPQQKPQQPPGRPQRGKVVA